jgi:hypothetical protein
MALERIATHDTEVQRHLSMCAAVLKREYAPTCAAIEHNGLACEASSE